MIDAALIYSFFVSSTISHISEDMNVRLLIYRRNFERVGDLAETY